MMTTMSYNAALVMMEVHHLSTLRHGEHIYNKRLCLKK
jgi:hypothetical protein